jgi:hypothetical protein
MGIAAILMVVFGVAGAGSPFPEQRDPRTIHVFHRQGIHFAPADSNHYDSMKIHASQGGRVVTRTLDLEPPPYPAQIEIRVAIHPVPKDAESVHDRWDRAGNVRLIRPGAPDLELLKFVTAYGGETEYRADVTELASLLRGRVTIKGFIDTWVSPAWTMDVALEWSPLPDSARGVAAAGDEEQLTPADWVAGLCYEESWTAERNGDQGLRVPVTIPPGLTRIVCEYLPSGHATDGRGGEEFEPREHLILVDGREVKRLQPWRDDCKAFRTINPYCRRWSDGSWSADYSRGGWCPGDQVAPIAIDMSAALTPGAHVLAIQIPGIRPRGDDGQFGYWRLSARLLGWKGSR